MKTSLFALLGWLTFAGCVAALWLRLDSLAIFLLAFVPLAMFLIHVRYPKRFGGRAIYFGIAFLVCVPPYVASIGPFNMWAIRYTFDYEALGKMNSIGSVVYAPLGPVVDRLPEPIVVYVAGNYIADWMDYGRDLIDYERVNSHAVPSVPHQVRGL